MTVGAQSYHLTTDGGNLSLTSSGALTASYSGGQIIGTGTDAITLGNSGDTLALSSSNWAISTTGDITGIGSIDQGLVAWWPLDEGTGDDVSDKSGQSNDGIIGKIKCPTGWVAVPGNDDYGDGSDFCVMKYEAKLDTGSIINDTCTTGEEDSSTNATLTSVAAGSPVVTVNLCAANKACVNSGGHLITNDEWMTIARNAEQVAANWQSGVVGTGCMFGGHMDNDPASALAASTDNDPYHGTKDVAGEAKCPFTITEGNGNASKRIFTLSNGEVIWDLSGNVREWTNDIAATTPGGVGWQEIENVFVWTGVQKSDVASAGGYTSAHGI